MLLSPQDFRQNIRYAPLDTARQHARVAVAVELFTIPFYLSALASIKDTTSPAYTAVLSVAVEEMLHLELAANLCIALGTTPSFTAPVYGEPPTFDGIPMLDPDDPVTRDKGILDAKIGNLVDVLPTMLDIETPTEFELGRLIPPYRSIGQMYAALGLLIRLAGAQAPYRLEHQVSGVFSPQTFTQTIGSYADARAAIDVIVGQGEGQAQSPPPSPPFEPSEFPVLSSDRTTNTRSVPPAQAAISHFGRFIAVQQMELTHRDVYTGVPAPTSATNQKLQKDFAALITILNGIWAGTTPTSAIWAMTALLGDAVNVWKAGEIPQWTP
jgi:hypothetical protein